MLCASLSQHRMKLYMHHTNDHLWQTQSLPMHRLWLPKLSVWNFVSFSYYFTYFPTVTQEIYLIFNSKSCISTYFVTWKNTPIQYIFLVIWRIKEYIFFCANVKLKHSSVLVSQINFKITFEFFFKKWIFSVTFI